MKYKFISITLVFLFLFFIAGCNKANSETPVPDGEKTSIPTVSDTSECEKLVSGYTDFGFNLYSALLKENKGKNIFISPSSIALALSMTYNGAEGETKEAMAEAMALNGMTLEEVNKEGSILINFLMDTDQDVEIAIANSLWCNPSITFKEDFIERCEKNYFAKVSNEFDKDIINGWIKENTGGKIENVIDEISPDAILYLINAIYFKGMWSEEFDKEQTGEMDFTLPDGTKKKHPLMFKDGDFNYYKGEKFQAMSLPYGDGRFSMYIFLPDEDSGLEEFQNNLNSENWQVWMDSFHESGGSVRLPRFKCEYKSILNDALKSIGMEIAFDGEKADFAGMTDTPAFISRVIHQTFVEVNEKGTEAAAVTVVEMAAGGPPPERFYMEVNRPFFFAIRDEKTGSVLFMGSISDPVE